MTAESLAVSPAMWAALELVVARSDACQAAYVVHHEPVGDAAVPVRTAEALRARGFVSIEGAWLAPTPAGRRALASHRRVEGQRRARASDAGVDDGECDHGSDPATCPPCRRAAGKDPARPLTFAQDGVASEPFPARFAGSCPECSLPIYAGQLLVVEEIPHTARRTVHARCAVRGGAR